MLNNPILFNDPTGHSESCEAGDVCRHPKPTPTPPPNNPGGGDGSKCNNDPDCELGRGKGGCNSTNCAAKKQDTNILTEQFEDYSLLNSWSDPWYIDPADFEELLGAIRSDVHYRAEWWLVVTAGAYDTPFYNRFGTLTGTGCIYGNCYSRTELNYIGQGELWAAVGVSKPMGHVIVIAWKGAKCAFMCGNSIQLKKTIDMFDIGFNHYHQLYPPGSPEPNRYIMPGSIIGEN